jgi:hypothetical protein
MRRESVPGQDPPLVGMLVILHRCRGGSREVRVGFLVKRRQAKVAAGAVVQIVQRGLQSSSTSRLSSARTRGTGALMGVSQSAVMQIILQESGLFDRARKRLPQADSTGCRHAHGRRCGSETRRAEGGRGTQEYHDINQRWGEDRVRSDWYTIGE